MATSGVLLADAHALPFAPRSFDVVIMLRVLGHLVQPEQTLAEAGRVLNPGGLLVVAAHGPGHLAEFWGRCGGEEVPKYLQDFERQVVRLPVMVSAQAAQTLTAAYGVSVWPIPPFTDHLELELFTFKI